MTMTDAFSCYCLVFLKLADLHNRYVRKPIIHMADMAYVLDDLICLIYVDRISENQLS